MADEATIRETTVTTERTGPSQLKERLSSVRDAIAEIEGEVRRDAENLNRLRNMLDVNYLEEFTQIVHELEVQVREVSEQAERSERIAAESRTKLNEEQERLEKLWDVYKTQEKELKDARATNADLETTVRSKDDEVTEARTQLDAVQRALEDAQRESGDLRQSRTDLLAQVEDLKALEHTQTALNELENELETERERLAKLYAAYEEVQAQRDDATGRLKRWETWYKTHGASLKAVCRASQETPGN